MNYQIPPLRRAILAAGAVIAAAGPAVLFAAPPATAAPKPATAAPKVPALRASTPTPTDRVPAGFADWNAVYAFQSRLNAAAERILAAGGAGNASIVAAPDSHQLRVYWKGRVPAKVRTVAATLDVPVVFSPARYTHNELVDQAKKLAADPRVFDAAPTADGGGVAVTTDAATARAATAGASTQLAQRGPDRLQAVTDVPLTITAGSRLQPMFSRQADTPAFYGGARYNGAGPLIISCTNGIPFGRTQIQILSAAHCSSDGLAANIPGQPTPTGTVSSTQFCRDTNVIFYPSGSAPRTYTGPSDSSTAVQILGATPDFVGNLVATSGATTGEHKNITVRAVDQFVQSDVGSCPAGTNVVGPMTNASYSDATCAVGDGDSGGPVYAYVGTNVVGRGTISFGRSGTANCPNDSNGSRSVYYAPLFRPAGDREMGTLDFYRASPPVTTAFDLNGKWTAGTGPSPFFRVNDTNITVDMSAFGRPNATGTITSTTSITVTFPDSGTYTGSLSGGNQILWSNNTVWTKPAPPTIFELNGKWTAGTGPGPFFHLNGNSITVDMSAFGRPNATGTVLNSTTISLTFPGSGTYTGRLSAPNNISWSNGTLWMKL